MRKILLSLSLLLATALTAMAQITEVTQGDAKYSVVANEQLNLKEPAGVAYNGSTADFSAQLASMLQAVGLEAASTTNFVQVDKDGAAFAYNENDGWHGADATIAGKTWGSEPKLVCVKPWADASTIDGTIQYIGCIDDTWTGGEVHTCYCATINDGKAALLTINITFAAPADFTVAVEQDPTDDYSPVPAVFKLSEIAAKLGTDAATLAAALEGGSAQFGLFDAEGNLIATTADGPGSYWMKADGSVTNWGAESVVYNGLVAYDAEADEFVIPVGQYPDVMKDGDTWSNEFTLKYNGAEVKLEVVLDVVKSAPEIAEPETLLSKVEIVKEYSYTLPFTEGKNAAKQYTFDLSGIYEALAIDSTTLNPNIAKVLMTSEIVVNEDQTCAFTDNILNHRTSTDGWFGRYTTYDEDKGEEIAILQNGLRSWGAGCTFYLQNPTLSNGELTITSGQYGGTLAAGDNDYAVLYVLNGNKGVKLTLTVSVEEAFKVDLANMTKVGEQTVEAASPIGDYITVETDIDLNDILTKFGVEDTEEISEWQLTDSLNVTDPTIYDYWLNEEGYAQAWGSDACAKVYPSDFKLASGKFTLLQMAGKYADITEIAGPFMMKYILAYKDKYYQINLNYSVKPDVHYDGEYECVGIETLERQIVPAGDYRYVNEDILDVDYIKAQIGTDEFVIYADAWDADNNTTVWTRTANCYDAENGGTGYWYGSENHENKEHQVVVTADGWNPSSSSFGFQYFASSKSIAWFQIPNLRQVGDSYDATIYLVNEENGKYLQYNLAISYVEKEGAGADIAGEENIIIPINDDTYVASEGLHVMNINMVKVLSTLGITPAEVESATPFVAKSKTKYVDVNYEGDQILINKDGFYTEDEEAAVISLALELNDNELSISVDDLSGYFESDDAVLNVTIGLQYDGKMYIQHLALAKDPAAVGINAAPAANAAVVIYNIAGQKLSAPVKGINIINGVKVIK